MNPGTCIHFTGMGLSPDGLARTCRAGVDYEKAFDGDRPGMACRAPCIEYMVVPASGRGSLVHANGTGFRKEWPRRGETVIPCGRRIAPTDEQVLQDRLETDAYMAKAMVAIEVSDRWRVKPKPKQPRQEVIECPVCKGRLHLAQSSINGHVHGQCETKGCVAWME